MPIARVNGININYKVEGQGESLVLIMGLGAPLSSWKYNIPFLKRYFQVIYFDNRGIGKSDKPEGPYSARMMAEDTIGLMDYLGIKKANILGFSMGGGIALEIALNYPSRMLKMILNSTSACIDENNGGTMEMLEAMKLPLRQASAMGLSLSLNDPIKRAIYIPIVKIQSLFLQKSDLAGLQGQLGAVKNYNYLKKLPSINIPTLVIVGTKDRNVKPSSSETIAKNMPKAKLVKIEGGSHLICAEMSARFNTEVLHFLKNN
jgi:pimeloyl-ACP methyl ester carboxylesterase